MRSVIRQNIWETNSSTTHSCVIMMRDNYDKWENGGYILREYDPFKKLPKDKKPKHNVVYTLDEVIEFYRLYGYKYNPEESSKEKFIDEMEDFITFEKWYDYDNLEYDKNYFTTPNGEEIVVCCKYGENY